ncbi:MAG: hypothetical protein ONB37_12660 [candidate division KSB1 bacterium]|nr:hypothetical protein [candidate division KSB1 bacterium]
MLYTLGLLAVGAAILVGIEKFNSAHQEASQHALTLDLLSIAAKAQAYYHTLKFLGGTPYPFSDLTKEADGLKKLGIAADNENGHFQIISANDHLVIIQAIGKDDYDGDGQKLTIQMKVYPDSVQTAVINY